MYYFGMRPVSCSLVFINKNAWTFWGDPCKTIRPALCSSRKLGGPLQ